MNIELTRFCVKTGKIEKVLEWMNFLKSNLPKVLETLEDEKMYVESIFHEHLNGRDFLYWYSIQGLEGAAVTQSTHEVDKKHLEFWKECIDSSCPAENLSHQITFLPKRVEGSF